MAYDSMGNVTCTRDALSNTTIMAYDASGTFATSVTNALGHVTSTTYYGVNGVAMDLGLYGQVKSVTDPNNAVVTSEYDALGRRTKVTQPDGFWTTTSYVSFGTVGSQHVRTDSQLGLSTWSYFDGLGRTIKGKSTGTDSNIIVTEAEYDARGAVTRSSTPYFETGGTPLWSTSIYDAMGRVVQATAPDGTRGLSCHDDWVSVTIDANDHKKRITRDAYGRVQAVHEYTGTFTTCDTAVGTPYATTTYAYDGLGNLKTLTDAKGNQSTMQYDTLSRKTSMHDPDMGDWTYQYDANGNLTLQTDAKTQQIHFQYDGLNRRVQKDYGTQKTLGSGDVVYTCDGATDNRIGRLQQVNDASGTTIFYYDNTGRVTKTDKIVDSTTYTTQSAYDALGRVTSITYPDTSTVTQTYNGPQLASVQEGSTTYARYSGFNALGQPTTLTLGNGVTTAYTYDAQNFRLKTLKTEKGTTVLQDLGYTFDDGGNVTSLTDAVNANQTFVYDDLDRLTSATGGYGTLTYSYNEIGIMLSNSQLGIYGYNTSGSSSVRPHAVISAGTNTYTYDANGNMILGSGRIITYDFENRPDSVIKDSVTTTFVYDGDGGRVKKSDGTTTTTYIGKLYVCEGGNCVKFIFTGDKRLAMMQVPSGSTSYFHADHLGSTSVLTDASGISEEGNAYYPYGDTYTHTGTSDVAYKYTGQELDSETGLYFYQARYYDAALGRFISPDTIIPDPTDPQSFNRYTYVLNNPLRYTDPTGNFSFDFSFDFNFNFDFLNPVFEFFSPAPAPTSIPSVNTPSPSAPSNNFSSSENVPVLETVVVEATPLLPPLFNTPRHNPLNFSSVAPFVFGSPSSGLFIAPAPILTFSLPTPGQQALQSAPGVEDIIPGVRQGKIIAGGVGIAISTGLKFGAKATGPIGLGKLLNSSQFDSILKFKGNALQFRNNGGAQKAFQKLRRDLGVSAEAITPRPGGIQTFRDANRTFTLRGSRKGDPTISVKTENIEQQIIIRFLEQ